MNKDISQLLQASILFTSPLVFVNPTLAQIIPDGTVPTQVNQTINVTEITGGAERGNNLFHSFDEFSVPTGNEALFNNATNIENIFSRVTGGSLSNIDGLIRANGSANLFLINPAGILFGANARLDIGGSFYGSTADSLLFDEGIEFSAVNPQNPILTINAPIGLRFRDNSASIINRSIATNDNFPPPNKGLIVKPNQTLALIGGDIRIEQEGRLDARIDGKIDLGGLSEAGIVEFNNDGSLSFPEGVEQADVLLLDEALIAINDVGKTGHITINARNLELSDDSSISAGNKGDLDSLQNRAFILINASNRVSLQGQAIINGILRGNAVGKVTAIDINTRILEIKSDFSLEEAARRNMAGTATRAAFVSAFGNTQSIVQDEVSILTIDAQDRINVDRGAIINQVREPNADKRGNVDINTSSFELTNGASVFLNNINFSSSLDIGELNINADRVLVDNSLLSTGLGAAAQINTGTNLEITANSVEVVNGGEISANSPGDGDAGSVIIETDRLTVRDDSKISVGSEGGGRAGKLDIQADSVVLNRGTLTASTEAETGGDIILDVEDNIILSNNSQITAQATGDAEGGTIKLETDNLIVNNSEITASATGEGSGGDLKIEVDSLNLDRGKISAETSAGTGGNITLDVDDNIILRNNSQITAEATGDADGGNINIEADFIIAPPNQNSDILASAEQQGTGGRIFIEAEGIFGLAVRPQNDTTNDIDASGGVDGEIIINTPDVDITKGAIQTPQNILVLEQIVAQACSSHEIAQGNSTLIVNGKGGVPPKPIAPIHSDAIYIDGETVNTQVEIAKKNLHADINNKKQNKAQDIVTLVENNQPVTIDDIIPAQGAIILENGDVVLTAYPTANSGDRFSDARKNCAT